MSESDPIRTWLVARGCPEHAVAGGLEGRVADWERTSHALARGEAMSMEEWLDHADVRQLIWELVQNFPEEFDVESDARLLTADELVREHSLPSEECIWGEETSRAEGWDLAVEWWYWRTPEHIEE